MDRGLRTRVGRDLWQNEGAFPGGEDGLALDVAGPLGVAEEDAFRPQFLLRRGLYPGLRNGAAYVRAALSTSFCSEIV